MGNCSSIKNGNRNIKPQLPEINHNERGKQYFSQVLRK